MGKNKDSMKDVPIQNYRKQIGKQDYKKSKTELKEVKARSQAKKCSGSIYKLCIASGRKIFIDCLLNVRS
ncbi:UNVERIFIED_CONTAM: triqk [Trichonephila clavipes]